MLKVIWRGLAMVGLFFLAACTASNDVNENADDVKLTKLTIGTGGLKGVYYPSGVAICETFMKGKTSGGLPCEAISTGGSAHNLNAMHEGKIELGISQADTVYRAWHGQSPFKERFNDLRVLFSLHRETVTLMVHKESNISTFKRIRGKKINIGAQGSGNERVVSELLDACKISPGDFEKIGREETSEMPKQINDRSMDGYFYVIGHPNDHVTGVSKETPIAILPLTGSCVESLVDNRSYYDLASIPGGLYEGVPNEVPTFGVRAWVLTGVDVPEKVVYNVVKSVFEDIENFRKRHPSFYRLSPRDMLPQFSVPYHNGALKYFAEKGWFTLEGQ